MADNRPQHWRAFDAAWFDRHQTTLCRIANAPLIGRILRRALKLETDLPLEKITPDAVHLRQDDRQSIGRFYTYPRYSQLIYEAFKPLWWAMHLWDEIIADRYHPEWSFGFDTLTVYTGDFDVTNFDGAIRSDGTTYTDARNGSGTLTYTVIDTSLIIENSRYASNDWSVSRTFLKFNVSSLPVNNVVTVANLKVAMLARFQTSGFNLQTHIGPMSDSATELIYADWTGSTTPDPTTPFNSAAFSVFNINDYTSLVINAAGRAYIQGEAGGFVPFVLRHSRDASGLTPSAVSYATFAAAENTADLPPMLEITYSRAILPNGFPINVTFGSPALTVTNPIVRPVGFETVVTFGQPRVFGPPLAMSLNGFAVNVTFGQPQINIIQPTGFAVNVVFGTPQINVIRPTGLEIPIVFGAPVVGRGKVAQLTGLQINVTFGQPAVSPVVWQVSPAGFAVPIQFGFVALSIPYPDGQQYSGPYISRLIDQPVEYGVTRYEYEDGGSSVNVQPCGARRWVLEYDGISQAEVDQLVRHYNAMRGRSAVFNFYHRRDNTLYSGVRYVSMTLPARSRAWSNSVSVTLERLE